MLGNHMVQRVIMIGKRAYENETSKATAGVRRRAGSVSQVRWSHAADSFRSAVARKNLCESKSCAASDYSSMKCGRGFTARKRIERKRSPARTPMLAMFGYGSPSMQIPSWFPHGG